MNLIEAIKSGKPFREVGTKDWLVVRDGMVCQLDDGYPLFSLRFVSRITAEYEIQEPTVTITRAQLADAVIEYIAATRDEAAFFAGRTVYPDPVKFLASKLGLESE